MTLQELRERQSWSLNKKIDHTLYVIENFINHCGGLDKVYISFSGGKDSTVLFHIARRLFPNILGVFCNTGNEYPDIIRFVREKQHEGWNIKIVRPKFTPRQVWSQYGFPLISKEQAQKIHELRINPNTSMRDKYLFGYAHIAKKYQYLLTAPFETSHQCCSKLKKEPMKSFEKTSGRCPITGIMASESMLRETMYIRHGGCNVLTGRVKSHPLSIWLESDIWDYIKRFNIPIADIYHKGMLRTGCMSCGFGVQFKDDPRLRILLREYPKCYDMVMNYTNNGVTFREALRQVLAINGMYLPDEEPSGLFDTIK